VKAVANGGGYMCALLTSGAVECWGDNTTGVLGTGDTVSSTAPVRVAF